MVTTDSYLFQGPVCPWVPMNRPVIYILYHSLIRWLLLMVSRHVR